MRDEGDCETDQDMSLSGRISRVERILSMSGFGGIETQYDMLGNRSTAERQYDMLGNRSTAERQKEEAWRRENVRTEPASGYEEITVRLQGVLDRVCHQTSRVEEIGRRVFGPLPEQANGAVAGVQAREPDGTMEHALIMCSYLEAMLDRLQGSISRIERV